MYSLEAGYVVQTYRHAKRGRQLIHESHEARRQALPIPSECPHIKSKTLHNPSSILVIPDETQEDRAKGIITKACFGCDDTIRETCSTHQQGQELTENKITKSNFMDEYLDI